jgi:hypothetical protein
MNENEVNEEQLAKNLVERNTPEELAKKLVTHMAMVNAAEPIVKWSELNKLKMRKLPFIPEDLGFEENVHRPKGSPPVRIYSKNGVHLTKNLNNMWVVAKDDMKMEFKIQNKFRAIMILTSIGMKFEEMSATVPDSINKPIEEILSSAKSEEE